MTTRAAFLKELPRPDLMKKRVRMFAMYDAIAAPEHRRFELHPSWGPGSAQVGAFNELFDLVKARLDTAERNRGAE